MNNTSGASVPPEYRLRQYRASDRDSCLLLFDSNTPPFFAPSERSAFARYLDNPPGPFLVLASSTEIAACGGYIIHGERQQAELCWGMVARTHQRHGYGRHVLEERIRRIGKDGRVRSIVIDTSQHTKSFFAQFGFREVSMMENGYGPGLHRYDMVLKIRSPSDFTVNTRGLEVTRSAHGASNGEG